MTDTTAAPRRPKKAKVPERPNRSRIPIDANGVAFRVALCDFIENYRDNYVWYDTEQAAHVGIPVAEVAAQITGTDESAYRKMFGKYLVNFTIDKLRQVLEALGLRLAIVTPDGTAHIIEAPTE